MAADGNVQGGSGMMWGYLGVSGGISECIRDVGGRKGVYLFFF